GRRDLQLLKEDIGHVDIVMLAGVHQGLTNPEPTGQGPHDRGHFHEIGASPYHMENVHNSFCLTRTMMNFLSGKMLLRTGAPALHLSFLRGLFAGGEGGQLYFLKFAPGDERGPALRHAFNDRRPSRYVSFVLSPCPCPPQVRPAITPQSLE